MNSIALVKDFTYFVAAKNLTFKFYYFIATYTLRDLRENTITLSMNYRFRIKYVYIGI